MNPRWLYVLLVPLLLCASSVSSQAPAPASEVVVSLEFRCLDLTGTPSLDSRRPAPSIPHDATPETFRLVVKEGKSGTLRVGEEHELRSRVVVDDRMARVVPTPYLDGTEIEVKARVSTDHKFAHLDIEFLRQKILEVRRYDEPVLLLEKQGSPWSLEVEVPKVDKIEARTEVIVPDGGTTLVFREDSGTDASEARSVLVMVTARIVALRAEEEQLFQQNIRKK